MTMSDTQNYDYMSEILNKLDLVLDILRITHHKEIQDFRNTLLEDPITKSIFGFTTGVQYGELVTKVAKKKDVSEKTVERRISDLRSLGLIKSKKVGKEVQLFLSPILG